MQRRSGLEPLPYVSAEEAAEAVLTLAERLNSIRIGQADRWPATDVRVVGPQNCREILMHSAMVLNILGHTQAGRIDFPWLVGLTAGDPEVAANILRGITQRSLVVMYQFQVENLLVRLSEGLGIKTSRSVEQQASTLLDRIGVSAPRRKASWVYLPFLIRNTMHNNGLHANRNRQITVNDFTFRFEKNRRFQQGGWHHIVWAFDAQLSILSESLHQPILATGQTILDPYAESVGLDGQG